jgi:hypothetical protein
MDEIKNAIANNAELSDSQIIQVFHQIGNRGDAILFKNDGLREKDKFTVVIISSSGTFDSIRFDDMSLSSVLSKALRKYFDVLEKLDKK